MFTVQEIAQKLNVSPTCVYQLIERGRLPCHRIGLGRGTIRVSRQDLRDYLSSCRHDRSSRPQTDGGYRRAVRLKHIRL